MPLYEYRCEQCGRLTERIQKFSDPELTVCPHCGGVLARTVTAPAVHFSGGGWYKDLYSSAKPPAANAGSDGGATSESAKGEASKAESSKGEGSMADGTGSSGDSGGGSSGGGSSGGSTASPAPAAASASPSSASKG